jgi:hypothetical protein
MRKRPRRLNGPARQPMAFWRRKAADWRERADDRWGQSLRSTRSHNRYASSEGKDFKVWPVAQTLIARNVIVVDDLQWIESLARLALVLILNDPASWSTSSAPIFL